MGLPCFRRVFGCEVADAAAMLGESGTAAAAMIPLAKLMAVSLPGTVDPSPFLYNTTMYTMAGLAALAAAAHTAIRPVDSKHYEKAN